MSLDISPDGRVLASASGFDHTTIHIWDTATGKPFKELDGHTVCVYDLAFTRDGRHLISAAGDQTIRFWDTSAWTETEVLRGNTDEVWSIAISEPTQLVASVSKDGDLKLWKMDGKRAADGYRPLSESLGDNGVQPLDSPTTGSASSGSSSRYLQRFPGREAMISRVSAPARPA